MSTPTDAGRTAALVGLLFGLAGGTAGLALTLAAGGAHDGSAALLLLAILPVVGSLALIRSIRVETVQAAAP